MGGDDSQTWKDSATPREKRLLSGHSELKLLGSKVREEKVWKRLRLERCQGWTLNGPPQ